MIVFPLKTNKKDSAISPLFGKAKYFAFYDGKSLQIEKNELNSGSKLIDWFISKNVDKIVIKEMGSSPYEKIKKTNIEIFYAGDERITSEELINKINDQSLQKLKEEQIKEIIKKHKNSHKHSSH
ncbi:NifB/NifX family molybdenum-iron cluster-binding protein [Arcobacter sp. YIC-80]|uniref:NifB/NifX family molybdenum-iron cluster-binding protein n=1 Tax=unclassified Arcobacter TaxID=2593671 RepID=UPI00384DE53A